MNSPLEVTHLRKSFAGQEVVADVSFRLQPGECYGLLGPNGAGKTTTLRCCLGLSAPASGEIRLNGLPVPHQARQARQQVGVAPQFDNLDPDFTCAENLIVYGRYFGLSSATLRARAPALLEFAGLGGREDAALRTLSGGMKRRLTLARALVNDPALLVLDEPTTGLDPQARHLIWDRLKRLLNEGKTILLTTHFMEEAERLCSRVAILDHGRLICEGVPRDLIRQHVESHVVEVFGEDAPGWAKAHGGKLAARFEVSGETAFCYAHDVAPLLEDLNKREKLRVLHRPGNLEDVFLRLTGRDLRD